MPDEHHDEIGPLYELKEATEDDVLDLAMQALFHTDKTDQTPKVLFLTEHVHEDGSLHQAPIGMLLLPHHELLEPFAEALEAAIGELPWRDPDEPLLAIVLIVHATIADISKNLEAVGGVRVAAAVTTGGGYTSAIQFDDSPQNSAGHTPPGWDVIESNGLVPHLRKMFDLISSEVGRRKGLT